MRANEPPHKLVVSMEYEFSGGREGKQNTLALRVAIGWMSMRREREGNSSVEPPAAGSDRSNRVCEYTCTLISHGTGISRNRIS